VVPGRLFAEIVRGLPPEPVELGMRGGQFTVACGGFHYTVRTLPADDYPALPPTPPRIGSLGADTFAAAVGRVVVAVGRDLTLPLLTAVRLADLGEALSLGCTDRYRMAVHRVPWRRSEPAAASQSVVGLQPAVGSQPAMGLQPAVGLQPAAEVGVVGAARLPVVLVPARMLAEAAKTLGSGRSRAGAEVHLGLGAGAFGIECGDRLMISRLIEVPAPDYEARVPHGGPWRAEVDTATLIETVKRVALVAAPLAPIRLAFAAGEVRLEAETGDEAKATATLGATLHGAAITVAFKPQFLLDGLAALDSDVATLTFTDPRQPVLLTGKATDESSDGGGGLRYLTMPLRL
jgi:DNA polymerase-3 subunit beta